MAAGHDRSRTAGVLIEQRRLHGNADIGPIGLHALSAVFGDDAILDTHHVQAASAARVDTDAVIVADLALGDVQIDYPVRRIGFDAATGIAGDRDVIECRIDAAACGRFEKYAGAAVRYPAVLYDEVECAIWLNVERYAREILENAILKDQTPAADHLERARWTADPVESHIAESQRYIAPIILQDSAGAIGRPPPQDPPGQSMSNARLASANDRLLISTTGPRHKIRPPVPAASSATNPSPNVGQGAEPVHP
jgi:hypothetical protein